MIPEKLYTLNYTIRIPGSNAICNYTMHGIVGLQYRDGNFRVYYDRLSSCESMFFPIIGQLVKMELLEKLPLDNSDTMGL